MKMRKILAITLAIAMLIGVLASCTSDNINVKYDKVYNQVYYSNVENKFIATGNTLSIKENYTYKESFKMFDKETKEFSGNYIKDDKLSLLYLVANDSSFDKFKRSYRSELKKLGYTASDIDNIILPSLSREGEIFAFDEYLFKVSSVNAAKIGKASDMNIVDGVYMFTGILGEEDKEMKLDLGNIYLMKKDAYGEKKYEQKIGEYEISGNIITIKPIDSINPGNKVNPPMKYLLADIELPKSYEDKKSEDGTYEGNSVITVNTGYKIKVIVGSFYTTEELR